MSVAILLVGAHAALMYMIPRPVCSVAGRLCLRVVALTSQLVGLGFLLFSGAVYLQIFLSMINRKREALSSLCLTEWLMAMPREIIHWLNTDTLVNVNQLDHGG